jgi:site-specific DNA-methyltransferase (adenine-specific)
MTNQELLDFKPTIDEHSCDNSIMFMWTTGPHLAFSTLLMKHWGFTYKTIAFVWEKICKNGEPRHGPGNYTGSCAEIVLLGIKGKNNGRFTPARKLVPQTIREPRRQHSRKPDTAAERIERMYPELSKIEMFAREQREGWTAWGNEVDKFNKIGVS